ncbi:MULTISPECIES: DUF4136 domain-containing protein [unclassified Shewanella]|jgi:hypothetical protein|uniref:DUF4136 domain-containing protein n=1 Tax=unclassified Shewanella TaxID=196818 RepID=UPI000C339362|nr:MULTISPECIES: DUF4136 domain-containing protein [unclassified Shewanella]MBB1364678.1 DUF4136 domain-containing protein [Shewanella sp. SR44-4]PKH31871.1 DUF4136 domain-containing protein [Shewanella sp. ALD9]QHS14372.1 DUF4136 domain-containing protein [Shewanella sp. Arc9-LZ]
MKTLFIAAAVLALSACSTLKSTSDFDPSVSFEQYKTYSWVEKKNEDAGYHLDGLMDQRVRAAVETQLSQKGISKADKQNADLLVNYITKVDKKINIDTFNSNFGYNPYYGPRWGFGGSLHSETTVREYDVGTLMVDLVDNKTGKLIWRGTVADTVREQSTPEERINTINQAIGTVMMNYPPKPNK